METLENDAKWLVVGASLIGKSHIATDTPCQDSFAHALLENRWGIAVVADGAGSASHSDKGSSFVVKACIKAFSQLIDREQWHENTETLPDADTWALEANKALKEVRAALEFFATESEVEVTALACTIIVLIYSPLGFLLTHIGDGRAAVQIKKNAHWRSAITPHKGTEANETVFITSAIWEENEVETLEVSGVSVPESRVIPCRPLAFALLSDGCEKHSFECSDFNEKEQKWSDPNLPYPKFFNPLTSNLKAAMESDIPQELLQEKWAAFLAQGTKGLRQEPDDKTMVIGILHSNTNE